MILDTPNDYFEDLITGNEDTIKEVGKSLYGVASRTAIKSFFSTQVPGVDASSMILFVFYKKTVGYFLYYRDGKIFFKTISNTKDIFTPNILDLDTLWPVFKEDVERRITG